MRLLLAPALLVLLRAGVAAQAPTGRDANAYGFAAEREAKAGRYELALQYCDQGLGIDPANAGLLELRAISLGGLKRFRLALEAVDRALLLTPDDPQAYRIRGSLHAKLREWRRAVEDATQAVTLDPKDADAYTIRGGALSALKEDEGALKDIDKGVALDPLNADARYFRAVLEARRQQYASALRDAGKAATLNPKFAPAHQLTGLIQLERGAYDAACAAFESALAAAEGSEVQFPLAGLAACRLKLGDPALAKATYKKAIAIEPAWAEGVEAVLKKEPLAEFYPQGKTINRALVDLVKAPD
jgi:tetratricopeptide (TPR) repeat protein